MLRGPLLPPAASSFLGYHRTDTQLGEVSTMSEEEGHPVDTTALQAQIDLSLSLTFDLVSSWVNVPGQSTITNGSPNGAESQRELEMMLHRPPK